MLNGIDQTGLRLLHCKLEALSDHGAEKIA
jgi:hypothetical protein